MANLNGFDANQVEPFSEFEPIPAGKYLAIRGKSEAQVEVVSGKSTPVSLVRKAPQG